MLLSLQCNLANRNNRPINKKKGFFDNINAHNTYILMSIWVATQENKNIKWERENLSYQVGFWMQVFCLQLNSCFYFSLWILMLNWCQINEIEKKKRTKKFIFCVSIFSTSHLKRYYADGENSNVNVLKYWIARAHLPMHQWMVYVLCIDISKELCEMVVLA